MCTVSFIKSDEKYIFTSNRDEKIVRPSAIPPNNYFINNKKVLFPKDAHAGGTWIAIDENGNIIVLLNGALEKHQLKNSYRKSRGLIVLDLISAPSVIDSWESINLQEIEPFTLVVLDKNKLFQLQWNEESKSIHELDKMKSHIWSSSTLYPKEIREERAKWFYDFINTDKQITYEDMYYFHSNTQEHDAENGLVINRNNQLKTVSISQAIIENNKVSFRYSDLLTNELFTNTFTTI
jgi:uncharacterized protein with NRDE domain